MKFKTVHLIWIAGYPSVAHSSKPRELMPTRVFFPSMSQSNGPPKSPLQVSLPPATTWLPYWFCWVANRPDQDSARDSLLPSALKYLFIIEKMWHWKKNSENISLWENSLRPLDLMLLERQHRRFHCHKVFSNMSTADKFFFQEDSIQLIAIQLPTYCRSRYYPIQHSST